MPRKPSTGLLGASESKRLADIERSRERTRKGSDIGEIPKVANPDRRESCRTNLELFLDLVFVFAVTQIASLISAHPSGTGTAKGLLMCVLVWWQWSQFTWAGSAVDLQGETRTRVMVLCLIPVTLIMTTT